MIEPSIWEQRHNQLVAAILTLASQSLSENHIDPVRETTIRYSQFMARIEDPESYQ